jgi:4-methylaminobutanoate oxidase (formaldehyde-forming)
LGPHELSEYHPLINTTDLQGGVFVAADAVADQAAICRVLANLAEAGGAKYVKNCKFENLVTENGRVAAVDTSQGLILCQFFVNCAGMVRNTYRFLNQL